MSKYFSNRISALLLAGLMVFGLLYLVGVVLDSDDTPPDQIVKEERALMGTTWLIQLSLGADDPTVAAKKSIDRVFLELSRIDQLMSEWKEDSPVSAINAAAGRDLVAVPEELRSLIERAVGFGRLTEGAFDITWKGMAHLWRFDESFRVPSNEEISAALGLVDFERVRIEDNRIGLELPEMALGLGGIAKGYAIDRAAAVLEKHGYQDFLVNGGGDVLTAGTRAGRPWKIGVRSPRGAWNQLVARLNLSGGAVVTSGDYERFTIVDGVRYHHIIDPRTGRPARSSRSVTVVAPAAEEADVLATAIFVQGPEKGLQLVSGKQDTEAFVIDASGKFWMTEGFKQLAEFY